MCTFNKLVSKVVVNVIRQTFGVSLVLLLVWRTTRICLRPTISSTSVGWDGIGHGFSIFLAWMYACYECFGISVGGQ